MVRVAKIKFEPSGFEVETKAGTHLVDLCDDHPASEVPFSCRSASCGTCRVEVKEGMENLSKPQDDELDVLDVFGDGKNIRLCCQVKLEKEGNVVLRVIEPQ